MTGYFYPNLRWDVRYPPNWSDIRLQAHRATGGICCCCKQELSVEAHHTRYLWKGDRPGLNVMPLCKACHDLSHHPRNWIKHKGNPLWKSANTTAWENRLRQGFIELSQGKTHMRQR